MPGYEVFGAEERNAVDEIFGINGGVLMECGFDSIRNGVYRVREFESSFAEFLGVSHAQAVSSGTAALSVALRALGIGPGDEVITQAFTFIATVEAIVSVDATPVVVDIDNSYNMCPVSLEKAISEKTKAIIPVHMMGVPAKMSEILAIAGKYDLKVIEDAAQAFGGTYKSKKIGTLGDVGAFSFDGGKTITTGEGGMAVFHDPEVYYMARSIHDHGHEYHSSLSRGEEGAKTIGFNYKMTELLGAIGLAQLKKADYILKRQKENHNRLMSLLKKMPVVFRERTDTEGDICDSIMFACSSKERATVFAKKMRENGLSTKNVPDALNWHFAGRWVFLKPKMKPFSMDLSQPLLFSEQLLEKTIALPIMVNMSEEIIESTADKLIRIAEEVL